MQKQPDLDDSYHGAVRSAWRPFSEMCLKLAGDPVLVPAPDREHLTRQDLTKITHWSDITEYDIPRLAILTDSFARFIEHGNDASVLTLWRNGTPVVKQIDGEPCEAAVDLVTDIVCGMRDMTCNEPEAANDNTSTERRQRLERLRKEHGGIEKDGVIYGASVQGEKGHIAIGIDGVARLHTHRAVHDLIETKPVRATPYTLRNPASIPEREWLYGRHYIRKYLTATVGAGGGGKSAHAISESLAMVTGRPLLNPDGPLTPPLRVWYINAEDPADEIDRRFHAAAKHFSIDAGQIGDRLFADSGRDQDFVIMRQEGRELKVVEPFVDEMVAEIRSRGVDVVIVDPFVSTHEAPENDNSLIQRVAKAWTDVADRANCCVEVIHHVVKSKDEVTADSARGGGALKDKTRSMRVVNPMSLAEAEKAGVHDPTRYFRVDLGKFNMTAKWHSAWRRFASVPLGNGAGLVKTGDEIGVVEPWAWPSSDDLAERAAEQRQAIVADVPHDLLAGLKVRLASGGYKVDPKGKPWAGDVLLETGIASDKGEAKAMLTVWIDAGELEVIEEIDPVARHPRKFVRPAATM